MPMWVWIVIGAAALLVLVGIVAWRVSVNRRSAHYRDSFGPEYDRLSDEVGRRDAEDELAYREERHEQFDLKPLPEESRERYSEDWRNVQAQFVDDPRGAIGTADKLLKSVMADRGYPIEDFDQRAADLSVDHPEVVQNYREGHRIAEQAKGDGNGASTDDLRHAMKHYRELFEELVGPTSGQRAA